MGIIGPIEYRVPGMTCAHCTHAVETELRAVPGVRDAVADLETKAVRVEGDELDDAALRAAIDLAGYEAD